MRIFPNWEGKRTWTMREPRSIQRLRYLRSRICSCPNYGAILIRGKTYPKNLSLIKFYYIFSEGRRMPGRLMRSGSWCCPTSAPALRSTGDTRPWLVAHPNTLLWLASLVFTSGATAGLKLVGESLDWAGAELRLHEDCHTSALGMRALAERGWDTT